MSRTRGKDTSGGPHCVAGGPGKATRGAHEHAGGENGAARNHESPAAAGPHRPLPEDAAGPAEELRRLEAELREARQQTAEALRTLVVAREQILAGAEESRQVREQARQAVEDFRQAQQLLTVARDAAQSVRQQALADAETFQAIREQAAEVREGLRAAQADLRHASQPRADGPTPAEAGAAAPADREEDTTGGAPDDPEDAAERETWFLDDAWAAEGEFLDAVQTLADGVTDAKARELLLEHRRQAHRHRERLADRMGALGKEPEGERGVFTWLLHRVGDALHRVVGPAVCPAGSLAQAYGALQLQAAVYRALAAHAGAAGDAETARLADELLREKQRMAAQLWDGIPAAVSRLTAPAPAGSR